MREIQNLDLNLYDFLPILQDFICPQCQTAGRNKQREDRKIHLQCPECGYRWSYLETAVHLDIMTNLLRGGISLRGLLQDIESIYRCMVI